MVTTIHPDHQTQHHDPATVALLSVLDLSGRCTVETTRFRRHEPAVDIYGFELFRRAIVDRDDSAWTAIYEQYAGAVRAWLDPWPGEIDEGVNIVFARFWRGLDGHKFASFSSLAAVLRYLKMCACTTRIDRARQTNGAPPQDPLSDAILALPAPDNVEECVVARSEGVAFWHAVAAGCGDARQCRVLYLSYVGGLAPPRLHALHPTEFPSIPELYRLKRQALQRLRGTQAYAAYLSGALQAALQPVIGGKPG